MNDEMMSLRFSSGPVQPGNDLDFIRETFGRKILGIEFDPLKGHALDIDLTLRSWPGFAMASGSLSAMHTRHPTAMIDNDDLILVVMQQGAGEFRQYGRTGAVAEGDAIFTANGTSAAFTSPAPIRVINLRLSRKLLAAHVENIDDMVVKPIQAHNPALQLLAGYIRFLDSQGELATAELRHLVTTHMHDLAALVLGVSDERLHAGGRRAARLTAIKAAILESLGYPGLSIGDIARNQGVSESYVRQLFAEAGTSFTDFVLGKRLTRAYRILTDPRCRDRGIGAIAYEVGFGDISYFNRTFRRRYGMTPSDAREAARRADKG